MTLTELAREAKWTKGKQGSWRFISYAEIEASGLVRRASGAMSTDPTEIDRDVAYILDLADRIRATARAALKD